MGSFFFLFASRPALLQLFFSVLVVVHKPRQDLPVFPSFPFCRARGTALSHPCVCVPLAASLQPFLPALLALVCALL